MADRFCLVAVAAVIGAAVSAVPSGGSDSATCGAIECQSGAPELPTDSSSLLQSGLRGRGASSQAQAGRGRSRAPQEYFSAMRPIVKKHWFKWRSSMPGTHKNTVAPTGSKGRTEAAGCSKFDPSNPQRVYWGYECSIANWDGEQFYVNKLANPPRYEKAKKGDIVAVACDDVYCPAPVVTDCYYTPDICTEGQFCWHLEHEKWGPWGVSSYGGYGQNMEQQGPDNVIGWTQPDYCAEYKGSMKKVEEYGENGNITSEQVSNSATLLCPSTGEVPSGTWRPIQGQCVKYRQEWQSCIDATLRYPNKHLNPKYSVSDSDGMPFERPLVCAPDLVCTGSKYYVMPNTCVKQRPADKCFFGSWWDSSICPRTIAAKKYNIEAGLNWNLTIEALKTAIITFPGEIVSPGGCLYWDVNNTDTAKGREAAWARQQLYDIVKLLWPAHTLPPIPSFEDLMSTIKDPFACENVTTGDECQAQSDEDSEEPNCVQQALIEGHWLQWQPNKLWSVVHFFMHNLVDPVPPEVADAAQALASWLGQYFTCNDCRGFFQVGVVGHIGLPPLSSRGQDIAKWYWNGHNIASEHVATTRGTHPWLTQLGDQSTFETPDGKPTSTYQNEWFMPWGTSVNQWTATWTLTTTKNTFCRATQNITTLTDKSVGECFDYCLSLQGCAGFDVSEELSECVFFDEKSYFLNGMVGWTCYEVTRKPTD